MAVGIHRIVGRIVSMANRTILEPTVERPSGRKIDRRLYTAVGGLNDRPNCRLDTAVPTAIAMAVRTVVVTAVGTAVATEVFNSCVIIIFNWSCCRVSVFASDVL